MKRISETAAGKSLSAWVVMNPGGLHVATVQAHFGPTGRTSVEVWNPHGAAVQRGSAGGYGYDKLTEALRGLSIDGHLLTGHCSRHRAPCPNRSPHFRPRTHP